MILFFTVSELAVKDSKMGLLRTKVSGRNCLELLHFEFHN